MDTEEYIKLSVEMARGSECQVKPADIVPVLAAYSALKRSGFVEYLNEKTGPCNPEHLGFIVGCVATEKNFVKHGALKERLV